MSENKSQTPAQNTPENSEKKKVSLFALIVVLVVAVIVMVKQQQQQESNTRDVQIWRLFTVRNRVKLPEHLQRM